MCRKLVPVTITSWEVERAQTRDRRRASPCVPAKGKRLLREGSAIRPRLSETSGDRRHSRNGRTAPDHVPVWRLPGRCRQYGAQRESGRTRRDSLWTENLTNFSIRFRPLGFREIRRCILADDEMADDAELCTLYRSADPCAR